jgi:hypothetical protein
MSDAPRRRRAAAAAAAAVRGGLVVIGHRGLGRGVVEGRLQNTPESVDAAVQLGLPWVEIDVRRTVDNVLMVVHNPAPRAAGRSPRAAPGRCRTRAWRRSTRSSPSCPGTSASCSTSSPSSTTRSARWAARPPDWSHPSHAARASAGPLWRTASTPRPCWCLAARPAPGRRRCRRRLRRRRPALAQPAVRGGCAAAAHAPCGVTGTPASREPCRTGHDPVPVGMPLYAVRVFVMTSACCRPSARAPRPLRSA